MKLKQYLNLLPVAGVLCGSLMLASCTDDIDVGIKVDEGAYEAVNRVDGMLLDVKSNKNSSVIEMRSAKYETDLFFRLSQMPKKGVDVKIEVDPAYAEVYNAEHGTSFELFPAANVAIERDGVLLLAPDDMRSVEVGVTLTEFEGMEADKTYLLPLCATSITEGITLSESAQHAVYLVKDLRSQSDCYKGEGAVKTCLYFEVNDTNPLNALEFVLKDSGKLFFDEVVLFSANINWDAEKGRVYVYNNPNVQALLDNNETYLQPLRKRGIKVILGILGNHDCAGVAQLSDMGCREFARELAAYCYAYNLDGVGFDDEYSGAANPDVNPWLAYPSGAAASRLLYETKKAMPDKTVMVYYLGNIYDYSITAVDGVEPGEFVDYAVADYGRAAGPMQGMTLSQCSGMSIELNRGSGDSSESTARSQKERGYGYYMFFALGHTTSLSGNDGFRSYKNQVNRCQNVARGLYGEELLMPTHYWKKKGEGVYDPVRYAFE